MWNNLLHFIVKVDYIMNSNQDIISRSLSDIPSGFQQSSSSGTGSFLNTNTSNSSAGWFSNFDWKVWLFLIFILAVLGFNIFTYLAKGTQTISDLFAPITNYFGGYIGNAAINTTRQIVDVSATGAKTGVDIAVGTVTTGLDVVQQTASNVKGKESSNSTQYNDNPNQYKDNSLNNALSNSLNNPTRNQSPDDTPTYTSDDSYSMIQKNKASGKAGFCYIGEDRGFRSCVSVGQNDTCMSGDIYPSNEICVNPTLRSG